MTGDKYTKDLWKKSMIFTMAEDSICIVELTMPLLHT